MPTNDLPIRPDGLPGPAPAGPAAAVTPAEEHIILVEHIDAGENPRKYFDPEKIRLLADNIAAHGLLNALIVYRDPTTGRYVLIAGECRLRAVRDVLGWKEVRARVLHDPPDEATRAELALIDNERQDLSDIERGLAYQAYLRRHGATASHLAKKLSMAVSTVTRCIKIAAGLPQDLQERVQGRTPPPLPPAVARELLFLPDDDAKRAIARLYPDTLKTRAEVVAAVRAARNGRGPVAAPETFTAQEGGVKIQVTLPAGQGPADAEAALQVLLKDLRPFSKRTLGEFKQFLAAKATAARKAAELAAAQGVLSDRLNGTPSRRLNHA